jgi:MinD superfamily P-loop ATPase
MPLLKCDNDHCKNDVPLENEDRVCAYQLDFLIETSKFGYRNYPTCNCCDACRQHCNEAAINPQSDLEE